jgi:hypothetical protein
MTANPYRPVEPRKNVKDLIEEMREELRVETGAKVIKPLGKPKIPAKRPANPNHSRPKKPKKRGKK